MMKVRELKEAIVAVFSPRFTTRFPAKPCQVPEKFRGKPEFDEKSCIGCGACVKVCPTEALSQIDDIEADTPVRKITRRYDTCIFCGNCSDNCTTDDGIGLSQEWDLATLDRNATADTIEFELQLCEKCGEVVGTKKHLIWLYDKLGPIAYANPSLLLAKSDELLTKVENAKQHPAPGKSEQKGAPRPDDFIKILCPKCKFELNIGL